MCVKRDEEQYCMSTIQLRGFYPPTNTGIRSRSAAASILCMMGAEDVLNKFTSVHFKDNVSKHRLTFTNSIVCLRNLSYLNESRRFCINNGETPPYKSSQLTPPRFEEQRKQLFDKAFEIRNEGVVFRHVFIIRNSTEYQRKGKGILLSRSHLQLAQPIQQILMTLLTIRNVQFALTL